MPSIAEDVRRLFLKELDAADGTGAKIKLCRAVLADPGSKDTFRQIAAMDQLSELLGPEALEDLLPYLGLNYWRLRDHSRQVAVPLIKAMGGAEIEALLAAASQPSKAGLFQSIALAKSQSALAAAKNGLKDDSPAVRAAAVTAYAALGGGTADIFAHLASAQSIGERHACEDVLLARIGDAPSIALLRKAAATDDAKEFNRVMFALSYSPSREADKVMLEIAAAAPKRAKILGPHSVRRMVIGPKGYGDITGDEAIDFADAMLRINLEPRIVKLLGYIHEARALNSLMFCLRNGYSDAAESLITNAEGMENLSAADAKIAAKALQDVIEYIEVTRLRGGLKAHMNKDDNYVGWKALQARAGKVLLKIHKPEAAPIPTFDDLDLDR